jgi:hypothetical protein
MGRSGPGNFDDSHVSCKSCGAIFQLETFDDDLVEHMMTRRGYQDRLDEMELLKRAQALFDAHSDAQQVIESIQRRGVDALFSDDEGESGGGERWLAEDRQLERWTEGDPELREYLEGSTVLSGLRRSTVQEILSRDDWVTRLRDPACPRCGEDALVFVGKVDWAAWEKKKRLRDQT